MNPRAVAATMPACSLYPLQGSLMLLDAHLVFQPFLAALGVSPHQVTQGKSCFWLTVIISVGIYMKMLENLNSLGTGPYGMRYLLNLRYGSKLVFVVTGQPSIV